MMSEGTKNIVQGMKARGIRKVVACLSGKSDSHKYVLKKITFNCFVVEYFLYFLLLTFKNKIKKAAKTKSKMNENYI